MQPPTRLAAAAQHGQAEQVIEAAAVDPDDDHLGAAQDLVQCQAAPGLTCPELGAGPTIGLQRQADLDVEVLGAQRLSSSSPASLAVS